jgi:hypothetical protein
MKEWNELMQERGNRCDKPVKPQAVAQELSKLLSDDGIVATDFRDRHHLDRTSPGRARIDDVLVFRESRHDGLRVSDRSFGGGIGTFEVRRARNCRETARSALLASRNNLR